MNIKNNLIVFFVIVFSAFNLEGMSFEDFKKGIIEKSTGKSKSGTEIYGFITPKLKGGIDAQIERLADHMRDEGHFGINRAPIDRDAERSRAKRWGTFFVQPNHTLFENREERIGIVRVIWDSKKLEYAGDVPGAPTIVYLDGEVPGVLGVAFGNPSADRPCFVRGGDVSVYEKENRTALLLALGVKLERSTFKTDEDWEIVQAVSKAVPHLVQKITIRIKLNCSDGSCEFNTCFPRD
jgi:hypothetical protein